MNNHGDGKVKSSENYGHYQFDKTDRLIFYNKTEVMVVAF